MATPIEVVRSNGGVCRTRDFRAAQISERWVAFAVRTGEIERARIGHFVDPALPIEVKQAVRVGGRLSCVSAAPLLGLRVLRHADRLHIVVDPHDSRFRRPTSPTTRMRMQLERQRVDPSVRLHWSAPRAGAEHPALVTIEDCLAHAIACLPALDAICMLDSARELQPDGTQLLGADGFARLLERLTPEQREIAERSVEHSQAVSETVARERLGGEGIVARPQVRLPGGYFPDLLIGERLVLECDGEGPHSAPGAFDRDRARHAWLVFAGYEVLHFSHRQILEEWPMVSSTIRARMRDGAHLAA